MPLCPMYSSVLRGTGSGQGRWVLLPRITPWLGASSWALRDLLGQGLCPASVDAWPGLGDCGVRVWSPSTMWHPWESATGLPGPLPTKDKLFPTRPHRHSPLSGRSGPFQEVVQHLCKHLSTSPHSRTRPRSNSVSPTLQTWLGHLHLPGPLLISPNHTPDIPGLPLGPTRHKSYVLRKL